MSIYDGSRIYNGCPDDTLQAKMDETKRLEAKLKTYNAHCKYHYEGMYSVMYKYEIIAWHGSKQEAILIALEKLGGY